jgi:adenosylhomocysteine nucleosidase
MKEACSACRLPQLIPVWARIAHVCYANRLPCLSVRTITDTESQAGVEVFERHCEQAAVISKDIVLDVLRELSTSP